MDEWFIRTRDTFGTEQRAAPLFHDKEGFHVVPSHRAVVVKALDLRANEDSPRRFRSCSRQSGEEKLEEQ